MGSGAWSNDQQDEIWAPNTVPFSPGNNVVGIGQSLPAEMLAKGYSSALLFYTAGYSDTATTPKVKYWFIAVNDVFSQLDSALTIGYGYVANPSVNTTAVVKDHYQFGCSFDPSSPPSPGNYFTFLNVNVNSVIIGSETTAHAGEIDTQTNTGTTTGTLP